MVKLLTFVKRQDGVDREAFLEYWRRTHVPLLDQLPDLRRRCSNVALVVPGKEPAFDLVLEAWWDQPEQIVSALAFPAGRSTRESLGRMADAGGVLSAIVSERVKKAPPETGGCTKAFVPIYKRPDVSFAFFDQHWGGPHAAFASQLPGLRGYVQCLALPVPAYPPQFDGCPIVWFDNIEFARAAARVPVHAEIKADEPRFLVQERLISVTTMPEKYTEEWQPGKNRTL